MARCDHGIIEPKCPCCFPKETADRIDAVVAMNTVQKFTNDDIKIMVERFLSWRLPHSFYPDGGISFIPPEKLYPHIENHPYPTGTNLFDAEQAEQMIRHILGMDCQKE